MKGAPDDLKIEENGALLKRIWIRTSKLTPPKECWPVLAPKNLINAILQMFHGNDSLLGHSGRHKTYSTLRERFTWRGMSFALAKWIRSCHHCLGRKGVPPQHRRYNLYEETQAPMNRIAVDIVGPLTTSKRGNQYIMTMFCPFSHWPEAYPISSTDAEAVIKCLKKHIQDHSVPSEILTDKGSNFLSKQMAEFLELMGAVKVTTTAYKPSSNGSIEGFHAYLAKALTALVENEHDTWDQYLGSVLFAYRTTPMDGLDVSPFEVLFGREPNLPIDTILRRENLQEPINTQHQYLQMIRNK